MKKILLIAIVTATTFTACKNNKTDLETSKDVVLTDTTGMYKSNILTDTGSMIITQPLTSANTSNGNNNANTTIFPFLFRLWSLTLRDVGTSNGVWKKSFRLGSIAMS